MILKSTPKCYLANLLIWMSPRQKNWEPLERCHHKLGGNKTDIAFTFWYICSSVSKIWSFLLQYAVTSFWIIFIFSERRWIFFHIRFNPKRYGICINIFIFQFNLRAIRPSSTRQIFNLYPRNRNIICRLNEAKILPEQHKQTAYHTPVTFIEARWQEAENMFFTSHSRNIFHPALTLFFPFILFALPVFKSSSE